MKGGQTTYAALILIMLLGLGLAYVLYSGPYYSFDDMNYITYAHQVLVGTFSPVQSPYAYGFMIPFTMAVSFAIFGVNTFAVAFPSIVRYIIIILATFLVARKLYKDEVAIISAFLVATAPFIVGYVTRALPDISTGAAASLSILFFLYAQNSKHRKLFYFLSGVAAAVTVYFKMIGLAYILFFIVAILIYKPEAKRKDAQRTNPLQHEGVAYPLAGLALMSVIYVTILFAYGGSITGPFVAYGQNQASISPSTFYKNILTLAIVLFGYSSSNALIGPVVDPQIFPLGFTLFWALAGTVISLYRREKNIIFLSVIFWGVFLYLFFGTVSITSYSFITVISRYFALVALPLCVIAGYALWDLYKVFAIVFKQRAKLMLGLLLALTLLSDLPIYLALYNYNMLIAGDARTISAVLSSVTSAAHGGNVYLYSNDNYAVSYLDFLMDYRGPVNASLLQFRSKGLLTSQLNGICTPNAVNTYILIDYNNYSKLQTETIVNNWLVPACNMTKVGSFNDSMAQSAIYNSYNLNIDLYKVR